MAELVLGVPGGDTAPSENAFSGLFLFACVGELLTGKLGANPIDGSDTFVRQAWQSSEHVCET